jgi:hypothetical protein
VLQRNGARITGHINRAGSNRSCIPTRCNSFEPVEHREADVGAVLGGIDVDTKRPLPEWGVDHVDDGVGN